jgi:hypothetical protein
LSGTKSLVNKNNYLMKYLILFGSGALFHYKSAYLFGLLQKGIVHIKDDGMSSIQGCLLDDSPRAKP